MRSIRGGGRAFVFESARRTAVLLSAMLLSFGLIECGSAAAEPLDRFAVSEVAIDGNAHVDTEAIRQQLKHRSGALSRDDIAEDTKALYATGFFDQVTASVVSEDGRAVLHYRVVEKPLVRKIFIKGNKEVSEDKLADILQFTGSRFLDKSRVEALMRKAVSYYQGQGYYDAAFQYSVTPVGENQVDLTFSVDEGASYKIRRISIRGAKQLDPDEIRSELQTKRYKWWSSWLFGTGRVNKEMLDNDKSIIRQFLVDHGFIDGSVADPLIEKKEDGALHVVFDLTEGPQYKVGSVTASGDLLDGDVKKTLEDTKIAPGDVFSAATVRDDSFKISEKFTDKGYAFANVVPNTQIRRAEQKVDLDYAVNKGSLVTVNRINIRGNQKTYENVIRRELKVDEQEQFSSSKVRKSQERLQRLGYFEEVNISTEPTGQPDQVDLNVNVREGSTGSFSAGAGYSSSDGAIFNIKLSEDNLFGTGRRMVLNVDLGTERNNYILSYTDERFEDSYLSVGADLLRTEREFRDFDRALTGGGFTLGYPLEQVFGEWAEDISASAKYEYLNVEISNVDPADAAPLVIASEGTSTSSAVTPRLVRNTINNPLNPTRGSRQSVGVELAGLGGTENFYLVDARQQWYYPVLSSVDYGDLVFSWRFSLGYGDTYDGEPLPLFRRFFPGGINSVRGYKSRSLGPKDANGNEYGGAKEVVNNLELIFPLVNSAGLRGVVFYDMGNAFDDNESIDLGNLRKGYGVGVRWASPLGPLRLEFGWPVSAQEGEKSPVTMFSFGAPI